MNLITQCAQWAGGEGLLLGHFLLNCMVPYCVAVYSAVRTRLPDCPLRESPEGS